jgi:hypothetical protein
LYILIDMDVWTKIQRKVVGAATLYKYLNEILGISANSQSRFITRSKVAL